MKFKGVLLSLLMFSTALADVTPMDAPLQEDGNTEITVKWDGSPVRCGKFAFKAPAGEYHYNLYIPPGYNDDPKELFPVIFVQMPGGKANVGKLKTRAKEGRYIVVGLVEAKNGPWDPIVANFAAAHDDVIKRCRVAEGFKYGTGFSGGARGSTLWSEMRPGFGGLLCQGASFWPQYSEVSPHNNAIGIVQAMGASDNNQKELTQFHKLVAPERGLYQLFWDGGHSPVTEDVIDIAFDWLEQWSYFDGPTQPAALPMYKQYLAKLLKQAEGDSQDLELYEVLDKIDRLATARGLVKDKELGPQIATNKKRLAELAKKDEVKKQLPARTAYLKVADQEYIARRKAGGDFAVHKRVLVDAAAAYEQVAKKHPDTGYAEKAIAAAARCKGESELTAKAK